METIKLLIVDDEDLIRERLVTVFPFARHGYQIVAEASNGEEALEICSTMDIDIVLTDVVMPVMDGLVFTKKLHALYPKIKVILLSCHDDFEYVREALRNGASDYLLKTTSDFDIILAALQNVRSGMDVSNHVDSIAPQNLHLKRWNVLCGNVVTSASDMISLFQIPKPRYSILMLQLKIFGYGYLCQKVSSETIEHIKIKILKIASTHQLPNAKISEFLSEQEYLGIVFTFPQTLIPPNQLDIVTLINELLLQIEREVKIICFCGCSPLLEGNRERFTAKDLLLLANKTQQSLNHSFYSPNERVFFVNSTQNKPFTKLTESFEAKLMATFQIAYNQTSREKALEHLSTLINIMQDASITPQDVKQFMFKLHQSTNEKDANYREQVNLGIHYIETIHDITEFITQYIFSKRFNFPIIETNNIYVKNTLQYLQEHYSESITLESLSIQLHLSPNYLSHLFKQEMNINVISCLNKIRIQQSMQLLSHPDISIQEVSDRVGIHDYKYFLKLFKRVTGQTPKEYRKEQTNSILT